MLSVKSATFGPIENNCYLITDEKTNKSALVDCTEDSDKMMNFIEGANLEYILLTHGHFDHIGGVKAVKAKTGAKVVISKEDEPMLTSSKLSLAAFCGGVQNNTEADILISDGDVITLGESEIKAIATPGHTKGGFAMCATAKYLRAILCSSAPAAELIFPVVHRLKLCKALKKSLRLTEI